MSINVLVHSIELCCIVVFDLNCNVLFCYFSLFCLFFLLLLPLMANKVVCVSTESWPVLLLWAGMVMPAGAGLFQGVKQHD